jgi:cytochrome c6
MGKSRTILIFAALLCATPAAAWAADNGAKVYQSRCAMCHGSDGKANTPAGKSFQTPGFDSAAVMKQSDADLAEIIRKGKGKMPAYGSQLTADQIQSLIAHIHALQGK